MVKALVSFSGWLAKHATVFVIGIAVFTFFLPHIFDWVRGNTQTVILGIIMLTMGLTLTTDDFRILARRPLDIFIGACAQFIIMPGVAYTLVHVFHLEPALALGILLVGCCPGGVSSNVMSYLCHGDVAFSVGMSCASTLVAPVMTPLLMQLLRRSDHPYRYSRNVQQHHNCHDHPCRCWLLPQLHVQQAQLLPHPTRSHARS